MKFPVFLSLIFLTAGVFSLAEAEAQLCISESVWAFDPPPVNGTLYADSTIQVCVDVVDYESEGYASLSGFELDFTLGWILSTASVVIAPQVCGTSGGEWVFLDTLICGDNNFGAGFYFDANDPDTGMPDGNFCNNAGDDCGSNPQSWNFCIEINLVNNCGNSKDVDLFPRIKLLSDEDLAGNASTACPDFIYVKPDFTTLALNCCAGIELESPEAVFLCESQCLINLFDIELEPPGYWIGPNGYFDNTPCGYYDVEENEPGEYTFWIDDILCAFSYTITVLETDFGIVDSVIICGEEQVLLENDSLPPGGMWIDPQGNILSGNIINVPSANPVGVYNYVYMVNGCNISAGVEVVNYEYLFADINLQQATVCESEEFQPFYEFNLDQVISPNLGNWVISDYTGDVLFIFYPYWDGSWTGEELLAFGDSLTFTYIVDLPPCGVYYYDMKVAIENENSESVSVQACAGLLDLWNFLPEGTPGSGIWSDYVENYDFGGFWDCAPCDADTYLSFLYEYEVDSGCGGSVGVDVTIQSMGAGSDYEIDLCANGDVVSLNSLLGADADVSGEFNSASPYVLADTAWSGNYTYTVADGGCTDTAAVYTINFIEEFGVNYEMVCQGYGTTYSAMVEFNGGVSPYFVNGVEVAGSISELESYPVSGGNILVVFDDSGPCEAIEILVGVSDSDGDGICDAIDITGCMDPEASNYNPLAINSGLCLYEIGPLDQTYSMEVDWGLGRPGNGGLVGSVEGEDNLELSVFPNPAVNELNLVIRGLRSKKSILEIRDILGAVRYKEVLASANGGVLKKIDLDGFTSGFYLVRVMNGGDEVVKKIFITP